LAITRGGDPVTDEEIVAHFTPDYLTRFTSEWIRGAIGSVAEGIVAASEVSVEETSSPLRTSVLLNVAGHGWTRWITEVELVAAHRISTIASQPM